MIHFVIDGTGTVIVSNAASSSIRVPNAGECITAAVSRWHIPEPAGGVVTVRSSLDLQLEGELVSARHRDLVGRASAAR